MEIVGVWCKVPKSCDRLDVQQRSLGAEDRNTQLESLFDKFDQCLQIKKFSKSAVSL
jgi:hypothetical protein